MNFEPAGLLEDASGGPLNMAVPVHDAFPLRVPPSQKPV